VIDEAGRDLHNVPGSLLQHLLGCALSDMEKPVDIDGQHVSKIFVRIVGEMFCDEDARIVDERVDAAEELQRLRDDAFRGFGIGDVTGNRQDVRIRRRLDRADIRDNADRDMPSPRLHRYPATHR
jgi:hypothetical protein